MEIEDRITNTELVVSAGRGRSYSVMIPRLARKYSVDVEVLQGCPQKGNASYGMAS
jgi:hypothetical protein